MKLYDYFRSSAAFRVRIALNLKGLAVEREFVHLRRREHKAEGYLALNPQGLVPVLVDDDGTVVTQSLAIIEYLDETRPEPPLVPRQPVPRARVRAISQAIACEIHPLNNLRVLGYLTRTFGIDEETRTERWYRHWIAEGLAGVEGLLVNSQDTGQYCHGEEPTMADCCLAPQIFNAKRFGCELAPYPTVMKVFDSCMTLDAFDAAQPSRQPDAEP